MVDAVAADARSHARQARYNGPKRAAESTRTTTKRRRLVHLGSSPPPFHAASHENGGQAQTATAPPSPRAEGKRHGLPTRTRTALSLRSSSPVATPSLATDAMFPPPPLQRARGKGVTSASGGEQGLRGQKHWIQRSRTLDCTDPDSPIGTFGGQAAPHPDGGRLRVQVRTSARRAGARSAEATVKPFADRVAHLTSANYNLGTKRLEVVEPINIDAAVRSNAHTARGDDPIHGADTRLNKMRRRQPKIQRIQLAGIQTSEQHPGSSPNGEDCAQHPAKGRQNANRPDAADESEITYFPTLPPRRPHAGTHSEAAMPSPENCPVRLEDASLPSLLPALQDVPGEDSHSDHDGDSSRGLLEVLSQTALRKIRRFESPEHPPQEALDATGSQAGSQVRARNLVRIDFDVTGISQLQAKRVAESLLQRGSNGQKWSSVHPDSESLQRWKPYTRLTPSSKAVRAAFSPPSPRSICGDLGLIAPSAARKTATERPEFAHFGLGADTSDEPANDHDVLAAFDHQVRFAGYRLEKQNAQAAPASALPVLEVFGSDPWPTRGGPVVKIIVPLSGPSLSPAASPARFIEPRCTSEEAFYPVADGAVVLVWTQATARAFLRALDEQLAAGALPGYAEPLGLDASEQELFPSPILHYVAGTGSSDAPDASTSSFVALYVHAHRISEARAALATLELGDTLCGAEGRFRPFADPLLRLLIVSMSGKPHGLI